MALGPISNPLTMPGRRTLGTRVPPRHEGGRQKRVHQFAALIGAGVAGLQDAPFGALVRGSLGLDHTRETDGIARQHRLDPAQLAKTRRRSPDRDLLAARGRFLHQALAVGDQELHADRTDMPSRRGQSAEERLAARLLVEVKRLRVELRGEFLDRFRGEGERSQITPRADFDLLKETHRTSYSAAASARRRTMIGDTI